MPIKQILTTKESLEILGILKLRFEKNMSRHAAVDWREVQKRLEKNPEKLWSLNEMEQSGGEPDVVKYDEKTGEFIFFDCSAETPKGRRSLCYDRRALTERKEHKPANCAMDLATEMGITILTEEQYYFLQTLGKYDLKTSSWVITPAPIRKLGGALCCERRYDHVFTFHNGASSYFAARGFRGWIGV